MSEETQVVKAERAAPERVREEPAFTPQVDVVETPESMLVLADLPGVSKEGLDVTLKSGMLTIQGRPEPEEVEGLKLDHEEYDVGRFYRRFALGSALDADNIDATLKDGVLRLVIPKTEEFRPRRIEISSG